MKILQRLTFYSFFKKFFSGDYHIYHQFIPLHSWNYLTKISIKINVATDEGNSRNEMQHWSNDEIGVAAESWVRVQIEPMAW